MTCVSSEMRAEKSADDGILVTTTGADVFEPSLDHPTSSESRCQRESSTGKRLITEVLLQRPARPWLEDQVSDTDHRIAKTKKLPDCIFRSAACRFTRV